jgi:hypothetical protein
MINSEILEKAAFRESPDGQWRYKISERKAFNIETQEDATTEWIERCLRDTVGIGEFKFYFWTMPQDAMVGCKALLMQLRRTGDRIVTARAN